MALNSNRETKARNVAQNLGEPTAAGIALIARHFTETELDEKSLFELVCLVYLLLMADQ
jgi:hypothetical protein